MRVSSGGMRSLLFSKSENSAERPETAEKIVSLLRPKTGGGNSGSEDVLPRVLARSAL